MSKGYLIMNNGRKIPSLGLGTWQSTDESASEKGLNAALETGYRHIDTAALYQNEHIIGRVLNQWFSAGKLKREDIFVTTKLPFPGIHEDRVEAFMNKSLDNLQLDYVDLYLIHFPIGTKYVPGEIMPNPVNMELEKTDHSAVWKKMEGLVDAGKTKAIGLSSFNQRQIEKILNIARIKPACLQVELHLCLQQKDLVDYCHKNNIVVVAFSPLGSPAFNNLKTAFGQELRLLPNLLENTVVKDIASKYKKTPGQVLLRFLIQKNTIPIPKSANPSRIKENFEIYDFAINEEEMKRLEGFDQGEKGRVFDYKFFPKVLSHPEFPFPQ